MSRATTVLENLQSLAHPAFEDMGNLKRIDKKLVPVFQTLVQMFGKRKGKKFLPGLGKKSPILMHSYKNAASLERALQTPEDKQKLDPIGMYVSLGATQVLSAALGKPSGRDSFGKKASASFMINLDAIRKVMGDNPETQKFLSLLGKRAGAESLANKTGAQQFYVPASSFYPVLTAIFGAFKEFKPSYNLIGYDKEGIKLQVQRQANRKGATAINFDTTKAKRDLWNRLDKYKTSKADVFLTPNELLAAIIKSGYMDKINLNGYGYSLDNERISLAALSGKDIWNKNAYIEYKLNEDDPKLKKNAKEFWALTKGKDSDDPEVLELRKALYPPKKLKVILKLEGGRIVPDRIETLH